MDALLVGVKSIVMLKLTFGEGIKEKLSCHAAS